MTGFERMALRCLLGINESLADLRRITLLRDGAGATADTDFESDEKLKRQVLSVLEHVTERDTRPLTPGEKAVTACLLEINDNLVVPLRMKDPPRRAKQLRHEIERARDNVGGEHDSNVVTSAEQDIDWGTRKPLAEDVVNKISNEKYDEARPAAPSIKVEDRVVPAGPTDEDLAVLDLARQCLVEKVVKASKLKWWLRLQQANTEQDIAEASKSLRKELNEEMRKSLEPTKPSGFADVRIGLTESKHALNAFEMTLFWGDESKSVGQIYRDPHGYTAVLTDHPGNMQFGRDLIHLVETLKRDDSPLVKALREESKGDSD